MWCPQNLLFPRMSSLNLDPGDNHTTCLVARFPFGFCSTMAFSHLSPQPASNSQNNLLQFKLIKFRIKSFKLLIHLWTFQSWTLKPSRCLSHTTLTDFSQCNFHLCHAGSCCNSHFLSFSIKCKCYRPFRHCLLYTQGEPTFKNVSHKSFLSPLLC